MKERKMDEIKKTIKEIFYFIDPDVKVDFHLEDDSSFRVDVKMRNPQILIGEKGQTLIETERLIKAIVRKRGEHSSFVRLDINDYRKRKEDYLRELAKEAGDETALTGVEKRFPPMSSFERRIVHTALSEREDVMTESIGEGPERRVVIKKKFS